MAPRQRPGASSSSSSAPLPPLSIDPSALLSDAISFSGTYPITIGANTILHPRCKLNSADGPIIIGSNCIVSEKTQLVAPDVDGLVVGDYVLVEVNCTIHAARIGEGTSIEVGAKLGKGCRIGNNCSLSPQSAALEGETLADYTVIYGENHHRIDTSNTAAARNEAMLAHIDCLKKLLPNKAEKYNR
ncbi:hypothetical protein DRE_06017 [Drechslerella stenobrocha 248]|uniref:Dynactin subunit 6 n=1 Tax=Drechslerella stenobrocha 248 TaxID=1043628 RepID=W7I8E8_9PEZI|nr:hypothetical protein DRE_06017 [Drechslerella stenobrocha 248]